MHTIGLLVGIGLILFCGIALMMGLRIIANAQRALRDQGIEERIPVAPGAARLLMAHSVGVIAGVVLVMWGWSG